MKAKDFPSVIETKERVHDEFAFFRRMTGEQTAEQEATEENDQVFLEKMARYTNSMNGVPVDRVSIPAADLLRLINMATSQQSLFSVRTDCIPPFCKEQ